jgi:hypothetical protein
VSSAIIFELHIPVPENRTALSSHIHMYIRILLLQRHIYSPMGICISIALILHSIWDTDPAQSISNSVTQASGEQVLV